MLALDKNTCLIIARRKEIPAISRYKTLRSTSMPARMSKIRGEAIKPLLNFELNRGDIVLPVEHELWHHHNRAKKRKLQPTHCIPKPLDRFTRAFNN